MTDVKQKDQPIQQSIQISENVTVIEKELKNDAVHNDQITGIQNLNDQEFITSGKE